MKISAPNLNIYANSLQKYIAKKENNSPVSFCQSSKQSLEISKMIAGLRVTYKEYYNPVRKKFEKKFILITPTNASSTSLEFDLPNSTLIKTNKTAWVRGKNSVETLQLTDAEIAKVRECVGIFKDGKLDKEDLIKVPYVKDALRFWLDIRHPRPTNLMN